MTTRLKEILFDLASRVMGWEVHDGIPEEDFSTLAHTVAVWCEPEQYFLVYPKSALTPDRVWNPLGNLADAWELLRQTGIQGLGLTLDKQLGEDPDRDWMCRLGENFAYARTPEEALLKAVHATIK